MRKANKLRALFPTFIWKSNIEVYEDEDTSKIVTYINVPENRIEIMWSNWDESSGQWYNDDPEITTLDDAVNQFDKIEFILLTKGIKNIIATKEYLDVWKK